MLQAKLDSQPLIGGKLAFEIDQTGYSVVLPSAPPPTNFHPEMISMTFSDYTEGHNGAVAKPTLPRPSSPQTLFPVSTSRSLTQFSSSQLLSTSVLASFLLLEVQLLFCF